jgi:hypothetical protein
MTTIDPKKANEAFQLEGTGGRDAQSEVNVFHRNCLKWLGTWVAKRGCVKAENTVCVFIFRRDEKIQPFFGNSVLLKAFGTAHPKQLGGRAFYCSADLSVVHDGGKLTCDEAPAVINWLGSAGTGKYAAVIFDTESLDAFFLDSDNLGEIVSGSIAASPKVKFQWPDLEQVLSDLYIRLLRSPSRSHCLWVPGKERTLMTQPEKRVQMVLYFGLLNRLERHGLGTIGVEVDNPEGREDIEIKVYLGNGQYELGIIELKVLRPDRGVDWNRGWALDAIKQAVDYTAGSVHNVVKKMACCFDGRKKDEAMPEFFAQAEKDSVDGRRYFMETEGISRVHVNYTT